MVQNCTFALGNLLPPPPEMEDHFLQLIEEAQVVQILTGTIKKNFQDRRLIQIALFTLGNLGREFGDLLFACDCLQITFQTIKCHPEVNPVVDALFLMQTMSYKGTRVTRVFYSPFLEQCAQYVLSNFGVGWLLDVIEKFQSEPKVVQLVLNFIYDLSFPCKNFFF